MSKHQTGLRIDRVLFKQFQQLCAAEKLRPGEAVESLIRNAVAAKTILGVSIDQTKQENTVRMLDDALFRSRLARLKKSLELEARYLKETGREMEEPDSDYWINELTELGRRGVSKELVQEFETCLTSADTLYGDAETESAEWKISQEKPQS